MKNELYPLKFDPILKEKIWGGEKLKTQLNKSISSKNIGESWEISDVKGSCSSVSNGKLKGKSLKELLKKYQAGLVGEKVYAQFGDTFPLLLKFIDAREHLSVQLHPNDELAKKRHDSFGKTEMWYIVQADKDAEIIVGFKEGVTAPDYLQKLEQKKLPSILNFEKVKSGDVFFIKPGLIHAIGAGVLLAEVQQTSDITYRVYDWDRKDNTGNKRELHTELAMEAVDFKDNNQFKIGYNDVKNESISLLNHSYFKTSKLTLNRNLTIDYTQKESFVVLMCTEGAAEIVVSNGKSELLKLGETLLLPACFDQVEIRTENTVLLEVSI